MNDPDRYFKKAAQKIETSRYSPTGQLLKFGKKVISSGNFFIFFIGLMTLPIWGILLAGIMVTEIFLIVPFYYLSDQLNDRNKK